MAQWSLKTPRVPHQTPMYDDPSADRPVMNRTWIIFFERISQFLAEFYDFFFSGEQVIGWDLQDCATGSDVSDPVIPLKTGNLEKCLIRIKVTDVSNPLEIDIKNNGVSIWNTRPLIAAGTTTRTPQEFSDFANDPETIAALDDPVLDIIQGGDWEVAVYLKYLPEAT